MFKHNSIAKTLKKQLISINASIESYFNKLKDFISNIKKSKFSKYNITFLTIGGIVILTLSYFSLPSFYDKNLIQKEIENQIKKKYNFEVKFKNSISYSLFPKPHFYSKNFSIVREGDEIANVETFKSFIAKGNFFRLNTVEVKDLAFQNAEFKIDWDDLIFFQNLLETEPNENSILIKNSNIFFKNEEDEILFLNRIENSKFYYDSINLENVLNSKNKIFNIPFKLTVRNNKFNKEFLANFNSKKIRLTIENKTSYENLIKSGLVKVLFINNSTEFNYDLKKNLLSFSSTNQKNSYKGISEFKPFYFSVNLNYDGLSFKNFLNDNSPFIDLVKTEILNNQNLNAELNLKVKDITNIDELNNLLLNINIEQGNFGFVNSSIMWKDDLKIIIDESLINYNNQIDLVGSALFEFKNIDNFYKSFQIPKSNRKKIDKIKLDFVYNLDQKKITFDNVKVDNSSNSDLNKFINDFNLKGKILNKITFKKFVSNFFVNYSG